ncbi:hypothetical protein [Streptomyces sp. NPDC007063]|uniref:hypothetical protein n=1 Tax=Streptomyces sp. NPDC007063 TaxID=3364772 RepID=UPI0036757B66
MTAVHTVQRGGARFYVSDDDTSIPVPGVTSILNMIPKPWLAAWQAKMAGEMAADSIADDYFVPMVKRDRRGAVDWVKGAAARHNSLRQDIGSGAHIIFEQMIRGESPDYSPVEDEYGRDIAARMPVFAAHFAEWLGLAQPTLHSAEDTAWSDRYGYAGSYDADISVRVDAETGQLSPDHGEPLRLLTDYKTGKDTYPEVAVQLTAYAYSDRLISPDGTTRPTPVFDGGAVLHVKEDGWAFKPVRISGDLHAFFLQCKEFFHAARDWEGEGRGRNRVPGLKDDLIGKPFAQSSRRAQTGTERRK